MILNAGNAIPRLVLNAIRVLLFRVMAYVNVSRYFYKLKVKNILILVFLTY